MGRGSTGQSSGASDVLFQSQPKRVVDTTAHGGLRGVAAVWIMVFHAIIYSNWSQDLQGSSIMPLFFVLSGFSLMLAYGSKTEADESCCCGPSWKKFIRNRFARTYPTYFATMIYAVPLWVLGYYGGGTTLSLVESLVGSTLLISTAVLFQLGVPVDGPGWTVCTLFIFWAFFPYSARKAKKMTTEKLISWLVGCYYLQLLYLLAAFLPLFMLMGYNSAFALSTMVPWVRYPCFLMGVYAGELCLRHSDGPGKDEAMMPWPYGIMFFFPTTCAVRAPTALSQPARWAAVADEYSAFALLATLFVALGNGVGMVYGIANVLGGFWLQAIMPFVQLTVVVALTKDQGLSRSSQFLRRPLLKWLGDVSMSLYLVHHPTIYYIVWAHNCNARGVCGAIDVPTGNDDNDHTMDGYLRNETLPLWGVPVVIGLSLPLAALLYYCIENPGRKLLRSRATAKGGTTNNYKPLTNGEGNMETV